MRENFITHGSEINCPLNKTKPEIHSLWALQREIVWNYWMIHFSTETKDRTYINYLRRKKQ
jgi:hypothetical protein